MKLDKATLVEKVMERSHQNMQNLVLMPVCVVDNILALESTYFGVGDKVEILIDPSKINATLPITFTDFIANYDFVDGVDAKFYKTTPTN